jgi:putative sigma-54 modulation protein
MQFTSTFRHMDSSQAVKQYALDRLEKVRKYFSRDPISAHAVFSVDRNHHHTAELQITLPNGLLIQARESTEDMYSSIDLAGARIERQVRKWKDKIRDHKPHGGPSFAVKNLVLGAEDLEPPRPGSGKGKPGKAVRGAKAARKPAPRKGGPVLAPKAPPPAPFRVVKEQTFTVRALRVEDAVMQMNLLESDFLVFHDVEGGTLTVVYRRKDGDYGLIDTGAQVSAKV